MEPTPPSAPREGAPRPGPGPVVTSETHVQIEVEEFKKIVQQIRTNELLGAAAADALEVAAGLQSVASPQSKGAKELRSEVAENREGAATEDAESNRAFVFIKPHAQTEAVQKMVKEKLAESKLTILQEGEIKADQIDSKQLIDQHYYAIASKATILTPDKLPVPEDKFKETFGEEWKDVLSAGNALNAMQACKEFGLDAKELETEWKKCKPDEKTLVKLGGGFYCGKITVGDKTKYVFNAFFMSMRSKFTAEGTSIYYYSVSWKPSDLSWSDFRGKLLGPTNPADAPEGSIRRTILDKYEELGLKDAPNGGDNGVHASASPFEGLAERMNWLEIPTEKDPFGAALLKSGFTNERIKEWSVDPQVDLPDGKKGSVFDALEDTDVADCAKKLSELNSANK